MAFPCKDHGSLCNWCVEPKQESGISCVRTNYKDGPKYKLDGQVLTVNWPKDTDLTTYGCNTMKCSTGWEETQSSYTCAEIPPSICPCGSEGSECLFPKPCLKRGRECLLAKQDQCCSNDCANQDPGVIEKGTCA